MYNNYIDEADIDLLQNVARQEDRVSLIKKTSSQLAEANQTIMNSYKCFMEMIQCGVCYQVLTTQNNPKQCKVCRNMLFCSGCATNLKNDCGYCKQTTEFVEVDRNMMKLVSFLSVKCPNSALGCKVLLNGSRLDMKKHIFQDC